MARDYALAGLQLATAATPAFVYEVEVDQTDGQATRLIDPVVEVAAQLGTPYEMRSYHHDGDSRFILGVADPAGSQAALNQAVQFPPPGTGTPRSPLLHIEFETMIRALRDAEILVAGAVAAQQVRRRIDVY